MKIERKDIDTLNIQLEMTLEKSDYKSNYDKKLKEYRGKVNMKGFRQGKTPVSFIKKMYGKGIFVDVINDTLAEGLNNYLEETKLEYLGQPMSTEDQIMYDFDPKDMTDYTFVFDIGLKPEIKIKGYTKASKYNDYKIDIPNELVEKEIEHMKSQLGERVQIEDSIEENDVIKLASVEQDGKKDKKDGVKADISSLVSRIKGKKLKKDILKLKKGDEIIFDVYDIEDIKDDSYLKKYILGIEEDVECGNMFRGEVIEIQRVIPAEMNEETFNKYFGEETGIKTEEEAKTQIIENMNNYFAASVLSLSNREMLESILDKNKFDLPVEILKKWLANTNKELTEEKIDADMEGFMKDLRWRLIKDKVAVDNDVEVTHDELRNLMYVRVESYFRNNYTFDVNQINSTVDQLMQDKEQLAQAQDEIISSKVFEIMRSKVSLTEVKITPEKLNEMVSVYEQPTGE